MNLNHTKKLVSSLQGLMVNEPSAADCKQVSRCLLDYLGATFAGVGLLKVKNNVIKNLLEGTGRACPVGLDTYVSLETAALING